MCQDFLNNEDFEPPKEEILILTYFAGHGCSDHSQFFLLNESESEKIFWPAEAKLRKIGQLCGSQVKVVAVYDICREPYESLKVKIEQALKEYNIKN